jgi:peptide/nickel transport system permease protein
MFRYILRRCLSGVVTLLGITFVTFIVVSLAPGDPAEMEVARMQDGKVSDELYQKIREYYNLDKPMPVQYAMWLGRIVRGDMGNSFHTGMNVSRTIGDAMIPTISVAMLSIFLTYLIAVPIGIFSAVRQGSLFDNIASTVVYMLYSVPPYVIGMLLILYFGVQLEWPFRGIVSDNYDELSTFGKMRDVAFHYVLAYYSRFTRQNLLEVTRNDYIRTARAKGLPEHVVILKHAFPNTLIPLITLMSLTFPFILSGSVIIETMFSWPGLGRLFYDSVMRRDYPTVMGLSVITAVLVLVITLLADLAYALVDPRVTYD